MSATAISGLDAAIREVIAESLRELFAGRAAGADLAPLLEDLGWADVLDADPAIATTLLFTEHGRALASSRALDDVVLAALIGLDVETRYAIAYPHPAEHSVVRASAAQVRALLLGDVQDVDFILSATTVADGTTVIHAVPATEVRAACTPVTGFDESTGWLEFSWAPGASVPSKIGGWDAGIAGARRALAAEILGVCDATLELAVAHASSREQFGRPIGSFQAVRHRLAEAYVAMSAAKATLETAWAATAATDGGLWAARIAKIRAGRAQAELMRHTVQTYGAMGVTQENTIHRYVTRAAVLDALLGGHQRLTEEIGASFLDGAEVDPAFDL